MAPFNECFFWKKLGHQTPEIIAFDELFTNFGLLYTNFNFKYEDSENLKADHTDAIIFNLHQIKHRACFFFGTLGTWFFPVH